MRPLLRILQVFGLILALSKISGAQVDEAQLRERLTASTVLVVTLNSDGDVNMGTGWVVSSERREIMTAYHVVHQRTAVAIMFPAKDSQGWVTDKARIAGLPSYRADIVRSAQDADLAVLRVPEMPANFPELSIATSLPQLGDTVYTVAHPNSSADLYQFFRGSVDGSGFHATTSTGRGSKTLIRGDAIAFRAEHITHGASGGALVNNAGEVVGVISNTPLRDEKYCNAMSVLEINRVLHTGNSPVAGTPRSVVGRWVCKQQNDEQEFAFEFSTDRKFTMLLPAKAITGTYRIKKEKVVLKLNGKSDSCDIDWLDDDHFILSDSDAAFDCRRYDGGWKSAR